jgi:hypothetical protein
LWNGGWLERGNLQLTNKINNAIRNAQGACSLDATAQLDDLGAQLAALHLRWVGDAVLLHLQPGKEVVGQMDEAGADVFANQVLALAVLALSGHLDLELALAEAQIHDGLAALRLARGRVPFIAHAAGAGQGFDARVVLLDLVVAGDAQVDAALSNEGGYVGSGQEDEGDGEVLDERDVEAVLTSELDVGAFKKV